MANVSISIVYGHGFSAIVFFTAYQCKWNMYFVYSIVLIGVLHMFLTYLCKNVFDMAKEQYRGPGTSSPEWNAVGRFFTRLAHTWAFTALTSQNVCFGKCTLAFRIVVIMPFGHSKADNGVSDYY